MRFLPGALREAVCPDVELHLLDAGYHLQGEHMLPYQKTTEEEKYLITCWAYPGEYAIYANPPYEEQKRAGSVFQIPRIIFIPSATEKLLWGSST